MIKNDVVISFSIDLFNIITFPNKNIFISSFISIQFDVMVMIGLDMVNMENGRELSHH